MGGILNIRLRSTYIRFHQLKCTAHCCHFYLVIIGMHNVFVITRRYIYEGKFRSLLRTKRTKVYTKVLYLLLAQLLASYYGYYEVILVCGDVF